MEVATEPQSLLGDALFVVGKTLWRMTGRRLCGGVGEYLHRREVAILPFEFDLVM